MTQENQPLTSHAKHPPKESMMAVIGKNIQFARKKKAMSQAELAVACGWKQFPSRISNYERGEREPKSQALSTLAKVLDVSVEWLFRDHGALQRLNVNEPVSTYNAIKYIPLLKASEVWAHIHNQPTSPIDYVPGINIEGQKSFAMIVEGDSMVTETGVSFYSGMTIIIDPDITPTNHRFVVALVNKIPVFKELIVDAGKQLLKPLNTRYPLLEIDHTVEIIGVLRFGFMAFS